jgi:threonine 3-dehydrogenase
VIDLKGTMMALLKNERAAGVDYARVPIPKYGVNEVLVRVKASSICGTDMHIYHWDAWAESAVVTPNIFGHEFAGIVEAVGSQVTNVKAGDHVSVEGHFTCGVCKACRTGNAHVCKYTRSFGISAPGCFAEYAVIPAGNAILNHPQFPFELACLQDPMGNAVQTVLSGEIVGKTVAVIGVGPIGLMAVLVAKACGAGRIYAVDINEYRLNMAKQFGADALINSSGKSISEELHKLTDGEGVEVVLEMSGNPAAIRQGIESAANAGRVSLLGIPSQDVAIDIAKHIIFKGIRLEGITGRKMYETWYQMKGLLDSGRVDLKPLVTHSFSLNQYKEAFELVRSGQCGKVVFIH